MDQTTSQPREYIHLVGSIPLTSTEEVFRTVTSSLISSVKRIPDGETGERYYFTRWQLENPIFYKYPILRHEFMTPELQTTFTKDEIEAIVANMAEYESGYDAAAIQSYQVFKRLRDEGVIAKDVRFMVALPTPVVLVGQMFRKALMAHVEPVVEAHMFEVVHRIQKVVPARDLAIQWDAPIEFALLEDGDAAIGGPGHIMEPWFEPVFEGVVERLVRLGEGVDNNVELGYHFCYGDVNRTHFLQPCDTGLMADVGAAVLKSIQRAVNWIHLPVPKDRTDVAYFEPLHKLVESMHESTELYLGVVHEYDPEGTRERIDAAKKVVPSFGVSAECGFGRRDVQAVQSSWQISREVIDSLN